jgi:hypothetical protein
MGKTLYLNESGNDLCVMRDGPSVWIKMRERAGQRVPVRLVERVVVMGNVKIDAGAITLWGENGIPVLFMDSSAREAALTIPYNHHLPDHYRDQKAFFQTEEQVKRCEKWAEAKRELICTNAFERFVRASGDRTARGLGEGNYQELLARIKPLGGGKWSVVTGVIDNLLRCLITERLIKAGLDPHLGVLHRRRNFGLTLDIGHIMGAERDLQAVQFFRSADAGLMMAQGNEGWHMAGKGIRSIAHRFENRRKALTDMVEGIIDELFEVMREMRA